MKHLVMIALASICGIAQAVDLVKGNTYRLKENICGIENPIGAGIRSASKGSTFEVLEIVGDKKYLVKFNSINEPRPRNCDDKDELVSNTELYMLKNAR